MIPRKPRAGRMIRFTAAALTAAALSACGVSNVDGVSVKWPPFKEGTPVALPSDAAQCPDLAGVYRAQGERREGDPQALLINDLHDFLLYPLDLPGMRGASMPAWRSSPAATVAFSKAAEGWDVLALDAQGARVVARLFLQDGGANAAEADWAAMRPGEAIRREAGCTQGRLWVSVRHDWRQHESTGVRRHVAILRKESDGLLLTVARESDSIGMLLPWYTNDSSQAQYWFAPAADRP